MQLSTNRPSLQHDRGRQRVADAGHRLQQAVLRVQAHPFLESLLQQLNLLPQRLAHGAVCFQGERHVARKTKLVDLRGRQPVPLTASPFRRLPVCRRASRPSIDNTWSVP